MKRLEKQELSRRAQANRIELAFLAPGEGEAVGPVIAADCAASITEMRTLMGLSVREALPAGWHRRWEVVTGAGDVVPLASRLGDGGVPSWRAGDALVRRVGSATTPKSIGAELLEEIQS